MARKSLHARKQLPAWLARHSGHTETNSIAIVCYPHFLPYADDKTEAWLMEPTLDRLARIALFQDINLAELFSLYRIRIPIVSASLVFRKTVSHKVMFAQMDTKHRYTPRTQRIKHGKTPENKLGLQNYQAYIQH